MRNKLWVLIITSSLGGNDDGPYVGAYTSEAAAKHALVVFVEDSPVYLADAHNPLTFERAGPILESETPYCWTIEEVVLNKQLMTAVSD